MPEPAQLPTPSRQNGDAIARPADPRVPLWHRLPVRMVVGLCGFFALALTATIIAVNQGGRAELEAQALRLNGEIGGKIVMNLSERLSTARALALAVAELPESLPADEQLFKRVIPEIIDLPGHQALIAGGGYWPEPGMFSPGVERRSFFWGRDGLQQLSYFDDYNAPDGPGYHHEEWYVPARFRRQGEVYWSRSYLDPYSFEPMVTCAAPARVEGEFRGVATIDLKLTGLSAFMEEQARAIGGYAFALDHNNRLISFPRPELGRQSSVDAAGKPTEEYLEVAALASVHPSFAAIAAAIREHDAAHVAELRVTKGDALDRLATEIDQASYQVEPPEAARIAANLLDDRSNTPNVAQLALDDDFFLREASIASLFTVPGTHWTVVVVTPERHATLAAVSVARKITLWMAVLVAVVCLVAYLFLHHQLIRPVGQLTSELRTLADQEVETGHLTFQSPSELGQLAHWFNARTARLAHALGELRHKNLALEHATRAAEEASRGKNVFLASMSHEIRTPMNAIIGMSSILKDTRLSQEQADYANTINTSAQSLLSLINDIMDFSKIEAGRLDLEVIEFDVRTVLEEVADLVSFQAEEKGLELICHFNPRASSRVRGDPGRLRQILLNLAANAIKFTESGQVSVLGDLEFADDGRVRVRFEVRDSGIGISRDAMERLFKPFSQVDNSTTRRFGGTGLGLAVCKRLCELMHGDIDVESMPGSGSTFRFHISLAPSTAHGPFPELPAARHALIVDPSAPQRRILRDVLESWSFRVIEAASADEGFAALAFNPAVDLVFVGVTADVRPTLIQRLRTMARDRRLDIVMHANHVAPELVAATSGTLKKPLRYSHLLQLLTRLAPTSGAPTTASGPAERATSAGVGASVSLPLKARVLIAEDNPVNQKVAQRLLSRLRVSCDIAGDGQQTFEAVQRSHYDLILMDWQMPVMDGMAATRHIRGLGGRFETLPIIAVTANAMEGDRERCLAAGMNDYLSKPITPEKLQAVLQKWLTAETERQE